MAEQTLKKPIKVGEATKNQQKKLPSWHEIQRVKLELENGNPAE
jgi:hypothetical protein